MQKQKHTYCVFQTACWTGFREASSEVRKGCTPELDSALESGERRFNRTLHASDGTAALNAIQFLVLSIR